MHLICAFNKIVYLMIKPYCQPKLYILFKQKTESDKTFVRTGNDFYKPRIIVQ